MRNNMSDFSPQAICQRIQQLRMQRQGPRGKSAFAKELGLSPSTYDYYEADRVPPAEILLRIANRTGVDLAWLLTGRSPEHEQTAPADHPALARAAKLLADAPNAGRALAAFLDLLSAASRFQDPAPTGSLPPDRKPHRSDKAPTPSNPNGEDHQAWIPILGRTAAGVPAFWQDDEDTEGITDLEDLIQASLGSKPGQVEAARVKTGSSDPLGRLEVQIVTLPQADENLPASQFVVCQQCRRRYPDAFALRVDGDSMAPEVPHGQLVLLSPSAEAVDSEPAVVQLEGQIGVTCKIFRRQGRSVHLIPINERYEPTTHPADQVVWALRVLARIVAG